MRSLLATLLFISLLWSLFALVVLLPLLGIAWAIAALTDLSLAQACLVTFSQSFILIYLSYSYISNNAPVAWIVTLWFTCITLPVAILEAHLIHRFLDLSLFYATLAASGSQLVVAYLFVHETMSDIPEPFRGILFEEWYEDDEIPSPPPKSRRRRKKRR